MIQRLPTETSHALIPFMNDVINGSFAPGYEVVLQSSGVTSWNCDTVTAHIPNISRLRSDVQQFSIKYMHAYIHV